MRDPDRTRHLLLEAARKEFALKGFGGARIDEIARSAGINKQALYYHFGNKEDLFRESLESGYRRFRERDREFDVNAASPEESLKTLIALTFHDLQQSPELIAMIMEENRQQGMHLNREHVRSINEPLIRTISTLLARGEQDGTFVPGVEPVQFYMSMLSLVMFYFSNIHTLSAVLDRDLESEASTRERLSHITDLLLKYVKT
jgi:TetR/AcrR family transcriptional regulator